MTETGLRLAYTPEFLPDSIDIAAGIKFFQLDIGGIGFVLSDIAGPVNNLTIQIAVIDFILIHNLQIPHACSRQVIG